MSVTFTYPGIYVQEFTPGAPIQGVSTSIGAFIGTASQGPINQPTLVTSWDEFVNVFGGFINEPPNTSVTQRSWLAPAVYGFFLNQGTQCYILRAVKLPLGVTSLNATANLPSRNPSWSITALTAASPVQATTALPNNFVTGQQIAITGSSPTFTGVSAGNYTITVVNSTTFTLNGTTGTGTYTSGSFTVSPTTAVTELVASAIAEGTIGNSISVTVSDSSQMASMLQKAASWSITAMTAASPVQVTTAAPNNFVTGQQIAITGSSPTFTGVSAGNYTITVVNATTFTLNGTTGTGTYASGSFTATTTADHLTATANLGASQLTFQVVLPPAPSTFVLSQALPAGALISITPAGGSTPQEYAFVAQTSGNSITLMSGLANAYSPAPDIRSCEFNLAVVGATTENWQYLSMNPVSPGYWQTAVNSQLITLSLPASPSSPPPSPPNDPRPADGVYPLTNGTDDDRGADLADINTEPTTYLNLLAPIQNADIVSIPGNTNANAQQALVTHCETLRNRFAVLDAVPDTAVGFPNLLTQYGQVRTPDGFAAIYFPWIQVVNPLTGATEYWPPCGHIIGIYALTDQTRGVYKAPANMPIAGALGLQSILTDADQGILNPMGINVLRVFPEQSQPLVWGARTTSTDSSWQYVNIRRLFIYLEQSIEQGIRWAVFEPNNNILWGKLNRTITEFLNRVEADGGIIDFYVRIDSALNPPATQALGQLFVEVGIQPTYPAEFIILRIGIWQGGSSVTES